VLSTSCATPAASAPTAASRLDTESFGLSQRVLGVLAVEDVPEQPVHLARPPQPTSPRAGVIHVHPQNLEAVAESLRPR